MRIWITLFMLFVYCSVESQDRDLSIYTWNKDLTILLNKSHAERNEILLKFYEWGIHDLDSATIFKTIERIDSIAKSNNERDLMLETALMRIHYYLYRDYYPRELIVSKTLALNEIAKKERILWLDIWTNSVLANYYFSVLEEYELGFEYYEITEKLLEGVSTEDFPMKPICLHQLGWAHYYFRDYQQSIVYFKKALNAYKTRASDFYYIHSLNTVALAYKHSKKLDSSDYYLQQLHDYSIQSNNEVWEAISSINLGYNHYLKGEYDVSIATLNHALERLIALKYWDLAGETLTKLAEVKFEIGEIDEAKAMTYNAKEYLQGYNNLGEKAKLYPLLAKSAALDLNPAMVNAYLDSALIVKDSLANLFSGLKLMRAKQKTLLERQKDETEKSEMAQQKELLFRNAIIVFLMCLFAIAYLIYRQYKLKSSARVLLLNTEKRLAVKEIDLFKKSILEKNEVIETLEKNLKKSLRAKESSMDSPHLTKDQKDQKIIINKLIESTLLTESNWKEFASLFETVHVGFFDRMNQKWRGLTPSEIRLITLSRLKLDNKKMARMLGVGTDAIRQVKSRLRRKVDIDTHVSFDEIVDQI